MPGHTQSFHNPFIDQGNEFAPCLAKVSVVYGCAMKFLSGQSSLPFVEIRPLGPVSGHSSGGTGPPELCDTSLAKGRREPPLYTLHVKKDSHAHL